jgi:hypothetical protein
MSTSNIDNLLTSIKKMQEDLGHEIERAHAVNEIQNLLSIYQYLHTAGLHKEQVNLFALKSPDVSVEIALTGVYVGEEGIRKQYEQLEMSQDEKMGRMGKLTIRPITTPCIQVAKDGKTAKGLWIFTGEETQREGDGEIHAHWGWGKYGIDFIKEDGAWKFWHLHVYSFFSCTFEESWVKVPEFKPILTNLPEELKPDKPTTYWWTYSPTVITENVPEPPEPYDTWKPGMGY